MPLSRRYTPEHPPGESCSFGLDYSFVIPPGVGISSGTLTIMTNTVPPIDASADWSIGPVTVRVRRSFEVPLPRPSPMHQRLRRRIRRPINNRRNEKRLGACHLRSYTGYSARPGAPRLLCDQGGDGPTSSGFTPRSVGAIMRQCHSRPARKSRSPKCALQAFTGS